MKIKAQFVKSCIPPRKNISHKYNYGSIGIIAGSKNFTGAAVLTANASPKVGCGLTTSFVLKSFAELVVPRFYPEVITFIIDDNDSGFFTESMCEPIKDCIKERKICALAIGPGIGKEPETYSLIRKILTDIDLPIVIDADAINCLRPDELPKNKKIILTPHEGEFARFIDESVEKIRKNREKITMNFAKKYKLVCVLKGYNTIVTDGYEVYINPTGNPGMAVGGSGDVLTGMITSLLPQVKDRNPLYAAIVGVYLHGLAGDIASEELSEMGLTPSDIINYIPAAIKRIWKK